MSTQRDVRVTIISKIWAYATGMIALSVLFSGPGRDWKVILLPATIVSGAAISTIIVWGKSGYRLHDVPLLSENLEQLKHRIENLEDIAVSSNMHWEDSPSPPGKVPTFMPKSCTDATSPVNK